MNCLFSGLFKRDIVGLEQPRCFFFQRSIFL